jgi:hypothetical protein
MSLRHRLLAHPAARAGRGDCASAGGAVIPVGVRVWLALGRTDMRKGMNGLALQVQQALGRDDSPAHRRPVRDRALDTQIRLPVWLDLLQPSRHPRRKPVKVSAPEITEISDRIRRLGDRVLDSLPQYEGQSFFRIRLCVLRLRRLAY